MRSFVALLVPALLLVGCGSDAPDTAHDPAASPAASTQVPDRPPPIMLVTDAGEVEAAPVSYCWQSGDSGMCVDMVGTALEDLPDVGDRSAVDFRFSMPGARFTAHLDEIGGPGQAEVQAVEVGDGSYRLVPGADVPPGRYRVFLEGHVSAGEAPGEFAWTLPTR